MGDDEKDTNRGRDLPKGPVFMAQDLVGVAVPHEIKAIYRRNKALRALEPYLSAADENLLSPAPVARTDKGAAKRKAKLAKLIQNALDAGVKRSQIPQSLLSDAGFLE